jgi:hypothetical protein
MTNKTLAMIFALTILAIPIYLGIKNRHHLSAHLVYSHAQIQEVSDHYKDPGIRFTYTFLCSSGQRFQRMSFLDCTVSKLREFKKDFTGKELPVIFDSTDCDDSFLIFTKQLARHFGVQYKLSQVDRTLINQIDSICGN